MKLLIQSRTWTPHHSCLLLDKYVHPTLYDGCKYLSMLGFKWIHVRKKDLCLQIVYAVLLHGVYGLRRPQHDDVIKWKHFRVTDHLCGEFTGPQWIPRTKASDAELWCFFFHLRLRKRLSKESCGWRFETSSRPLWRQCTGLHLN